MADPQPSGLVDTYQLYIDGSWVEPEDGRYDDIYPATEQTDRHRARRERRPGRRGDRGRAAGFRRRAVGQA